MAAATTTRDDDKDAVRSQVRQIIEHLLKLEHSPSTHPRRAWRLSVREVRVRVNDALTGTLERETREALDKLYEGGRELAVEAMREFGEEAAASRVPDACPYTFDKILDAAWFPAPRADGVGG